MKKLLLALVLFALAGLATAADSQHDVQALLARGDYPGAEALLREDITEHPQSAKAHYVLAEVLAHEGKNGEAKAEAAKAAGGFCQLGFAQGNPFLRCGVGAGQGGAQPGNGVERFRRGRPYGQGARA